MEERERAGSRTGSVSSGLGPLRSGKNTPLESIDIRPASRSGKNTPLENIDVQPASRSGKNTPQGSRSASRIADLSEEEIVRNMPQVKPLPPIGKENKDGGAQSGRTSPAESVSSQGSAAQTSKPRIIAFRREMSYDSGSDDSDDSTQRKKTTTPAIRETSTKLGLDGRTHTVISTPCQTEWSWTETMKKAGLLGDSDDNADGLDTGRLSGQEARAKSRGDKSKSSLSVARSVDDDAVSKVPSIGPSESFPPRDDEYGIPILELDTSDTEDDDYDEGADTLPSIGPPDILKFKRETEKDSESSSLDLEERENEFKDLIGKSVDSKGRPLGIFTGVCEFCQKTIKPFPSMEEQQTKPPDQLYCCEEYRQFVHFALFNPMETEHKVDEKIDIKPHGPFGSKQARRAAKERAVLRMRERELARAQQVAAAQQAAAGGGGVSNFFTFARAMKTINYQLSSQRCLDEGWTVRPPSPLWEEAKDPDVFSVEDVDFTMNAKEGLGWELRKRGVTLEKYYEDGSLFLVLFPDGTGHVYYPSGNLAIGISSTTPGKFTYVILEDAAEEPQVLGVFEPNGHAGCYFHNGKLRLCLDQMGGIELDINGAKKKKWNWKDVTTHVHAPPFQPICFALNRCLSLRFLDQDNISLLFQSHKQSCKFNVGAKLKLVNPEYIPVKEIEENEVFLSECKTKVEFLLDKVANLMKFPKSPKLDKLQPPLSVVSQAQRTEKLRRSRAVQEAAKQEQNKTSVSVT
ncbi:glutamate-rich protein 6-like [Lingula anatina]|uniref:Glutamate-rich protein 6-like n=1 Tax=Lingula anatina TaxID=7574 RepID=A0A1S3JRJ2_LINAN|nr:glutamate-rich protein 6-like [Lingula anatina]|eukprot:XP_013412599.1 glutamate-rich protein 6-like [Lingula anatina]